MQLFVTTFSMPTLLRLSVWALFILGSSCHLEAQVLIEQITSFSAENFTAKDCGDGNTVTFGSSLCVTDLEGSNCANCGDDQFTGDNSSSYRISGIDVSDYCSVFVQVIISGDSEGSPFEGRGQCGEDRIRLRISSGGDADTDTDYPQGVSYFTELVAFLPVSGNLLDITIELGTQKKTERLCIEEISVFGEGSGIRARPAADEILVCTGEDVRLRLRDTKAGETYQWFKGGTLLAGETRAELRINDAQASDAGIYIVETRNSSGCESIDEVELFLEEGGTGRIAVSDVIECEGEQVSLRARTSNEDLEGDFYYEWSDENGNTILSGTGEDELDLGMLDASDGGSYCVFIVDPNAACDPESPVCALVELIEGPGRVNSDIIFACTGERVRLRARTERTGDYEYTWFDENGTIVLSGLNEDVLDLGHPEQALETIYTVAVAAPGTPCISEAEFLITIAQDPGRIQGNDEYFACEGQSLTLNARPENDGTYDFEWIFPSNSPAPFTGSDGTITIPNVTAEYGGLYLLSVFDNMMGCVSEFEVFVFVETMPTPPSITKSAAACGEFPTLNATVTSNLEVFWYDSPTSADNGYIAVGSSFSPSVLGTYYALTSELPPPNSCVSERTAITITEDDIRFIGESCDDGNPNTINDQIQADCTCSGTLSSLINPPFDCFVAQRICTPVYRENTFRSTTTGLALDEIQDEATCLFDSDERGIVWYTFVVDNTGDLGFLITPDNPNADLDWALFDLTTASCDDLSRTADLLVSCNATNGNGCQGITGMSSEGQYDVQGTGCDNNPPDINSGNSAINALVPVQAGNRYVLAVQNWTFVQEGRFQPYTIDFSPSINVGVIDTNPPLLVDVQTAHSICANEPITLFFNEGISCENINNATATLTARDGSTINTEIFAADCLRGASVVREVVVTADFEGAESGSYTLLIENNAANRQAFMDGCGNSMELPISTQIFLPPDNSLDVSIRNTTPNANTCVGETVRLEVSTFPPDFFGNNSYTWRLNGNVIGTGTTIEVTQPGTYEVEMRRNGNTSSPACETGTAYYTVGLPTISVPNGPDCAGDLETYRVNIETEAGNTLTSPVGTITGSDGSFTIQNIPTGQSITITVTNPEGCTREQAIASPDCACPPIPAPQSNGSKAICEDEAIPTLSVNANLGFGRDVRWYTTAVGGTPIATGASFTPSQAGTYYAEAYLINSICTSDSRTAVTLDIFPTPNVFIQGTAQVCPNETTTLTAGIVGEAAAVFQWSNGVNSPSITVGVGTYCVAVTDANGCENSACVTVLQAPIPTLTIPAAPSCAADNQTYSVRINTEAINTVTASNGNISGGGGFLTNYNIPLGMPTTIIVTNPEGCSTVRTIQSPNCEDNDCSNNQATIVGSSQVCPWERTAISANLTSGGIADIQWSASAANSNSLSVVVGPGSYSVTITDNNGCEWVASKEITNFEVAQAIISGNTSVCEGESTTLTASAGQAYAWSTGQTSQSISIGQAGTYTVTVIDANGCESWSSISVSQAPIPNITLVDFGNCSDDLQTYSVRVNTEAENTVSVNFGFITGGGGFYTIQDIPNGQNATIRVTNPEGCEASRIIQAPDCACPPILAPQSNGDVEVCEGEPLPSLSVASNLGTNEEIRWYDSPVGGTLIATGSNFTPTQAATYYVEVYDIVSNCSSYLRTAVSLSIINCDCIPPSLTLPTAPSCAGNSLTYAVRVNTAPENTLTSTAGIVAGSSGFLTVYNIPVGQDITLTVTSPDGCTNSRTIQSPICNGDPCANVRAIIEGNAQLCPGVATQLIARLEGGNAATFEWNNFASSDRVAVSTGSYTVTITDTNGCTAEASITISESPLPTLDFPIAPICSDDGQSYSIQVRTEATNSVSANAGTITGEAGIFSIADIPANMPITISVQNVEGCEITEVFAAPDCATDTCNNPNASISGDLEVCEGERTVLTASGGVSYKWSNFAQSDKVGVLAGTYTVTITDENECETILTATVVEIDCEETPCPPKAAPQSTGDKQICEGEVIPALSVTSAGVNLTSEIRWYNVESGGTAIATGLSFTPSAASTYYAEIYDTNNDCPSPRRAISISIIACIGDDVATFGQTDGNNAFTVLHVQPNPFKTETNIIFQQHTDDWIAITIYDIAGRVLHQERDYYTKGVHQWKVQETLLGESGVYFYRIHNTTQQVVGKLILQH